MSIGLIYEDFEENEQKIRSARKRAIHVIWNHLPKSLRKS